MANNKIQMKRTSVAGRTPNTTNSGNTSFIDAGELAVNLTDQKVFTSNGTVYFEVGANLTNLAVTTITANGTIGSTGQALFSNGTGVYWGTGTGYTGSQGITGYTGSQGLLGYTGSKGDTGAQGVIGYTGSQGIQGNLGYTGSQGVGYTGSQGSTGYTGSVALGALNWVQNNVSAQQWANTTDSFPKQLASVTITTHGSPVQIAAFGDANPQAAGNWGRIQIYRGASAITGNVQFEASNANENNPYAFNFIDNPAAGTYTYYLYCTQVAGGNVQFGESNGPVLNAIELQNVLGYTGSAGTGYTGSAGAGYTGSQGTTGYTGSQGSQGVIGYTGSQGPQGNIGYTGSQGDQGIQGFTGSQGIGYTGSQGVQGIQGFTGSQGSQGSTGFTGSQGIQGIQGYTGSEGIQGDTGYTGSQGIQGIQGFTGSQGVKGDTGFTGSQGYTGSQGSQGLIGYTGSQGIQGIQGYTGSKGDQGPIGYTGSQGIKGDLGYTGSQGPQGNIGYTGSQGPQGIIGYTGSKGDQGLIGYTGSQGNIGYTGSAGPAGGANTQVQFNDSGQANGTSNFTYNKTTSQLSLTGNMAITGNLEVTGAINTYSANNLSVSDNMIYLNANATNSNPDLGFAGNYNDGIYRHAGFFRDASDGVWKVFDSYLPEPDANVYIDTANASFHIADLQANTFYVKAISANGVLGTSGQGLVSNGSAVYWADNPGYTGSRGVTGYTGSQGIQGNIGYTGSQGAQGNIGYTGSQGIQGIQGYTGSQGNIGYTGSQGPQGNIGYTGSQGPQGVIGYTGSQGPQGVIGYTGSQGPQGVIGYTGSQGPQGLIGYTGSQGPQGINGYTGSQGPQGVIGYTGSQGSQGVVGYTGSQGTQGNIGYTGSQGIQGIQGFTGSQGTQGVIGYTGSAGPAGGSNTQIQFNDSGVANGATGFTFNKSTNAVALPGTLSVGNTTITGFANVSTTLQVGGVATFAANANFDSGTLFVDGTNNRVGVLTTAPGYTLEVNGSFAATTKSFLIDHPTKPGMKLRYGSLEGPENGVYVRGRLRADNIIELPDYWTGLVDEDTITVNLTPIGKGQSLYVAYIGDGFIRVENETTADIDCFYTVFAERKDVEKLVVEF